VLQLTILAIHGPATFREVERWKSKGFFGDRSRIMVDFRTISEFNPRKDLEKMLVPP